MLVRELGTGGMSTVYLGRDEVLDRPVAVKILHPDLDDEETGARFRREGRTAARLSHPNIVPVYDAGEDLVDGKEVSYIVMEYLPGGDLKGLMNRRGALPEGMLSRLGADVAAALAHAHERGVIHRDVKPQNVLLDERGNPKLADFGIARALDTTIETRTGSYLGTAAYSSPEQLRGDKVTPKADVYALGTTLYHAAAGEPPFAGAPIEVANQHILKKPVPPTERGASVGRGFETLVLDCLEKDPDRRPTAFRVYEKLLQRGKVAAPGAPAGPDAGTPRSSRAVGAVKAAGASGLGAVRGWLDRDPPASGPPEHTISLPTRTFRTGARQRLIVLAIGAALLLALLIGGAWAMLGSENGAETSNNAGQQARVPNAQQGSERDQQGGGAAEAQQPEGNNPDENAGGAVQGGGENPGEAARPSLPLPQAEQAVFDMYVNQSFREVGPTWNALSSRLQNEIGSPQEWAEQEQINTFTDMYYIQVPTATAAGEEAEVTFEAELFREDGSEVLSGTWICVVEDGEWKLDRLEDNRSTETPY